MSGERGLDGECTRKTGSAEICVLRWGNLEGLEMTAGNDGFEKHRAALKRSREADLGRKSEDYLRMPPNIDILLLEVRNAGASSVMLPTVGGEDAKFSVRGMFGEFWVLVPLDDVARRAAHEDVGIVFRQIGANVHDAYPVQHCGGQDAA